MKIVFDDDREDIVIGTKKDDKEIKTTKAKDKKPKGKPRKSKKSKGKTAE